MDLSALLCLHLPPRTVTTRVAIKDLRRTLRLIPGPPAVRASLASAGGVRPQPALSSLFSTQQRCIVARAFAVGTPLTTATSGFSAVVSLAGRGARSALPCWSQGDSVSPQRPPGQRPLPGWKLALWSVTLQGGSCGDFPAPNLLPAGLGDAGAGRNRRWLAQVCSDMEKRQVRSCPWAPGRLS